MPERRFTDDEVRRILSTAAEQERAPALPAERGWTLAEVQQMGAEAGLPSAVVASAALTLDRAYEPAEARLLGLPVAVSRAVPLARAMTEEDWERLVARLRQTFAVEGRVRVTGPRREWRVGNLRVTHEPAGEGAILDLRTHKGNARPTIGIGVVALIVAVVMGALARDGGAEPRAVGMAVIVAVFGVLALAFGALSLPVWASARTRQFESLGEFARRLSAP